MSFDRDAVARLLQGARHRAAGVLLESEAMAVLEAIGIPVPRHAVVRGAAEAARLDLAGFAGERVVLKVLSPAILHKTEAQGVAIVRNDRAAVAEGLAAMERRFAGQAVDGYLVCEFVPHEPSPGHELLLGMRWTDEFGPVVTVGPGGIHTEFLNLALRPDRNLALLSPALADGDAVERALCETAVTRLVTGGQRGRPPEVPLERLADLTRRFLAFAREFMPEPVGEFEVNPLVVSGGRLVALDALLKLGGPRAPRAPERPLAKLRCLLEPRTVAVIGVSEKMNPGRIIVQNLLREGFDRDRITVIKPGLETIDGCHCVPEIAALPERVDLLVLSIAAAQVPEAVTAILEGQRAESIIIIPGGLEERAGTESLVARMRESLLASRRTAWQGPVINGGNCLGVRSVPGRINTLFIPEYKLPVPRGETSPFALISGSGAFVCAKANKLAGLNPRYSISLGNQTDLTLGDYLTFLKDDPAVEIFAVYAEGFRPLDGLRLLEAAREIVAGGRTVLLYRAGRTQAGAAAAASHTAAVAGDYPVTRRLAGEAGVVVAETLEDFEDLARLFTWLRGKRVGWRLGALSNAGFECVAIADNLGRFQLAGYRDATTAALRGVLERARIGEIVDVRNPIDLTPILGDGGYEEVARLILSDEGVDVGIVGMVPMTPALNTLPPSPEHRDDLRRPDSVAMRMVKLKRECPKAWVAVVDGGVIYDPMVQLLEQGGVPTFRTADRALRLFNVYCEAVLRSSVPVAAS